jgi:hypothetical protein
VRIHLRALLVASVFVAACSKPAPPASSTPDASSGDAVAPSAVDAGVSVESARAVVDAWLAAQNGGDFRAYEALYAARFEGVRRSGSQTAHLDRARWMKERRRMFEQKTTVAVRDVVVTTSGSGADVRFVQTWAQESYRDEGPKHMVLTSEKGQLRIAREEMLASTTVAPGTVSRERFMFAVDAGGPHLVLSDRPLEAWATGAPSLVAKREPWITRRAATGLPADLAAWSTRRVELFGDHGAVCEGTVSTLSIIGRVVPHFGRVSQWMGTGDFQGERKASDVEIARDAWELSGNEGASDHDGRMLVAQVKPESGDCKGALWGRPVTTDKPAIAPGTVPDAATKALALTEIRKTKAYADTQARYETEKDPKDPKRWEDFDAHVEARVFAHPSGTTIVTLSISSGVGCGSFGGTLSATWELTGGKLTLVGGPEPEVLVPSAATDVDGDGSLDLVFPESLLRKKNGVYQGPSKLQIPFLDCGC